MHNVSRVTHARIAQDSHQIGSKISCHMVIFLLYCLYMPDGTVSKGRHHDGKTARRLPKITRVVFTQAQTRKVRLLLCAKVAGWRDLHFLAKQPSQCDQGADIEENGASASAIKVIRLGQPGNFLAEAPAVPQHRISTLFCAKKA